MSIQKKSHGDLPATIRLVKEIRNELRAEIRALDSKMKSGFKRVDARFNDIDARFDSLQADIHRTQVIIEEQRNENRIVLDGLKVVIDRQDRLEHEHAQTRRMVESIAPAKRND